MASTNGSSSGVVCPATVKECPDQTVLKCHNGGLCCENDKGDTFCACPSGYVGDCLISEEDFKDLLESRDRTMQIISLSSAISIAVGIIALVALGVITFVIVRNYRKRGPWGFGPFEKEPDLDTTIIYVQEEISKLSTVQQLNKLQRLSKLFEKTVREAILSEPNEKIERPDSVAMNAYLPRWSSAPTCINRPSNDLDVTDGGDDVFKKPPLHAVFSLQ